MTREKRAALGTIGVGLAVAAAGFVLNAMLGALSQRLGHAFSLLITFGNVIFVVGCISLAQAKGQPWYVGLLGLLSCLGLAILWFVVPERRR
jgi:hypothetical protein